MHISGDSSTHSSTYKIKENNNNICEKLLATLPANRHGVVTVNTAVNSRFSLGN